MSTFSEETLRRTAKLARLELPDAQLAALGHVMSSILTLIDQLQAVETGDVTPLAHPLWVREDITFAMSQRSPRGDIPDPSINRDANLRNAPQTENGLFLVPKVIE